MVRAATWWRCALVRMSPGENRVLGFDSLDFQLTFKEHVCSPRPLQGPGRRRKRRSPIEVEEGGKEEEEER